MNLYRSSHSWLMLLLSLIFLCSFYVRGQDTTGGANILKTIADPMIMQNGDPVTSAEQWKNSRRSELLDFFVNEMYGQAPPKPTNIYFTLVESDTLALEGLATRKQIRVEFKVKTKSAGFDLLLYLPNKVKKPAPVFLGLNFHGNHTIAPDPAILITESWVKNKTLNVTDNRATEASRGMMTKQWPLEMILKNGYGVATLYAGDITPDDKAAHLQGVQKLYPELQKGGANFSAMASWAWGLSRAMDALEQEPKVDPNAVMVFGSSRMGKAALWAGAIDERFAMVISNESGAGGAKLFHHHFNEDIAQICRVFPYWFTRNFQKYAGRDNTLPFDQHLMMSLIAPRPLLITSGQEAYVCDPYGEFLGARAVSPVYAFLGEDPLPEVAKPEVNTLYFGQVGYYMRSGIHDILPYDWEQFIVFADKQFK